MSLFIYLIMLFRSIIRMVFGIYFFLSRICGYMNSLRIILSKGNFFLIVELFEFVEDYFFFKVFEGMLFCGFLYV